MLCGRDFVSLILDGSCVDIVIGLGSVPVNENVGNVADTLIAPGSD